MTMRKARNYVDGEWVESSSTRVQDVLNPATDEPIGQIPLSTREEANAAAEAAAAAFWEWRSTPPPTRARYMFRLKEAMEEHFEELARLVTDENGKTIDEARGEVRRAIENVEVAAGIPSLLMGYNAEDVAQEIDEEALRQPIGAFAMLAPFNFPAMVPFWFLPYAVACGDTYVVKPSSQAPLTQNRLFELMDEEVGFPPGVVNLVNGSHEVADALMDHPKIKGISFVGSTAVGEYVYRRSTASGKRAQCQAGAKNFLLVMPDANLDRTVPAIMTSCFGCAGERCLAGSVVLAMDEVYEELKVRLVAAASRIKVGYGADETVQMGPVISKAARAKILSYVEKGIAEGAELLLDGRNVKVEGYPKGYFVGPTIFDKVSPEMAIAQEEIFGPVFGIVRVGSFEEALSIIDANPYGNAASIFTGSGRWAREFKYRVQCGNIGINIGIAAPIAYFPFGGMRKSFFGDLHGQGLDAIQFFTDRKVVISRWF